MPLSYLLLNLCTGLAVVLAGLLLNLSYAGFFLTVFNASRWLYGLYGVFTGEEFYFGLVIGLVGERVSYFCLLVRIRPV